MSSVNSEQFIQSGRRSESRITLVEEIRKPKIASALTEEGRWQFNPDRAQDSDSDTSQDQEGNAAEKDYGEKPNTASAQEAPVYIHSQKLTSAAGQKMLALSQFFGDRDLVLAGLMRFGLKLRLLILPFSCGKPHLCRR